MKRAAEIFQLIVLCGGIGFLSMFVLAFGFYALGQAAKKMRRRLGALLSLLLVAFAVYLGGGKSIRWDTGLSDHGSLITNDTVHIEWTYSGIPSASTLYIDYRPEGDQSAEWVTLAETTVAALSWDGTLANATNYAYYVYTTYVPPSPVHTNGVWVGPVYETKKRHGAQSFIVINGVIREHGRAIAPPNAKRKEEEDEE